MRADRQATEAAGFADARSFVGLRLHPGTDHPCIYLRGADVGPVRRVIFEREKGRCWNCGAYYGWDYGEMDHKQGGLGLDRCWCPENLQWSCPKCHRAKHVRPRFGEGRGESAESSESS